MRIEVVEVPPYKGIELIKVHVFDGDPQKCPQGRINGCLPKSLYGAGKLARKMRQLGSSVTADELREACKS